MNEARMAAMEQRLARLEAVEAICAVVARYAIAADLHNDPALFGALFAQRAVWEARGFGRHEGRAAILAALAEVGRQTMLWTTHFNVAPLVEPAADLASARCRWYLWELARMADGADGADGAADHWIAGTYDARLIVEGGAWRIAELQLDLRLMTPVAAPAFAPQVAA
ncbi:MAG TPA: nuclear transport factor 2 family protein [Novosphingobium sp.]|nr:nuclear transport factor 2 family protein [Novosphingobium sp.]HZV10383.1 nuclear transport factor 2 family protein [Novosphingobium sp.]